MKRTDADVLRAAAAGDVVVERYRPKAHDAATGRLLSLAAVRRAIDAGKIRRYLTASLNFHYEITDEGREDLGSSQSQPAHEETLR